MKRLYCPNSAILKSNSSPSPPPPFSFPFNPPPGAGASLERSCVAQLSRIVRITGAKIVLSTSWRLFPDMKSFLVTALEQFEEPSCVAPQGLTGEQTRRPLKDAIVGETAELGPRGIEVITIRALPNVVAVGNPTARALHILLRAANLHNLKIRKNSDPW